MARLPVGTERGQDNANDSHDGGDGMAPAQHIAVLAAVTAAFFFLALRRLAR